jgi:hypothetical protein
MNVGTMLRRRRHARKLLRVARMLRDLDEVSQDRPAGRPSRRFAVRRAA